MQFKVLISNAYQRQRESYNDAVASFLSSFIVAKEYLIRFALTSRNRLLVLINRIVEIGTKTGHETSNAHRGL